MTNRFIDDRSMVNYNSERTLVSNAHGVVSLTMKTSPTKWDGRGCGDNMVFPYEVEVR